MLQVFGTILGGIGLFLLGMTLMSEGLRAAAGDALRSLLQRSTGTRLRSVATGTVITAIAQSSSATTLATIGFVSAGLITFTQAVGVIFGANLGTTMTSWLVALIGLNFDVAAVALPLVGVGAFLRLLGRGRSAHVGGIVAGFGLIFVGIDFLQAGMATFSEAVSPGDFAIGGILGRLALVGVGIAMTVVTQSSSAAIAATLAALAAGTIDMPQAAALVIGQNVGTTVTAALGSIGATVPAKRTALAHILFNVLTGIIAFLALPLFLGAVHRLTVAVGHADPATSIAAFHTAFNLVGVAIMLPLLGPFTRAVERLVPGPERRFTSGLDSSTQLVPAIALDAATRSISQMLSTLVTTIAGSLEPAGRDEALTQLQPDLEAGIAQARDFLRGVVTSPHDERLFARHVAVLHALDHLERCLSWAAKVGLAKVARETEELCTPRDLLLAQLDVARTWFESSDPDREIEPLASLSNQITRSRQQARTDLLEKAAREKVDVTSQQRALNWLNRIAYHVWRAAHHLGGHAATPSDPVEPME